MNKRTGAALAVLGGATPNGNEPASAKANESVTTGQASASE